MALRLLAVDDEPLALQSLVSVLKATEPESDIRGFSDAWTALDEMYETGFFPDVAFLDIEMRDMTGLELAKRVREKSKCTRVVFVTAYTEYMREAYALHARGYLLKPVTERMIRDELDEISLPLPPVPMKIKARCFGNFEVFSGSQPLSFKRSKAKELLAYLIHRNGSVCTTREIAAVLFEDKTYNLSIQSQVQSIISDMIRALSEVGARDVVVRRRNALSVDASQVDCDVYRFFRLDVEAVSSYVGEYMAQYDWAEFTLGYLDKLAERK